MRQAIERGSGSMATTMAVHSVFFAEDLHPLNTLFTVVTLLNTPILRQA